MQVTHVQKQWHKQHLSALLEFWLQTSFDTCSSRLNRMLDHCCPKKAFRSSSCSRTKDWLKSSCVMNARRTSSQQIWGDEKFTTYKDLKTRYGSAIAKKIRDDKHAMNSSVPDGDMPFTMPHPDCPGNEEPIFQTCKYASSGFVHKTMCTGGA